MRSRLDIEHDHKGFDFLSLEVLLDIRELLRKDEPAPLYVKTGEPKKVKRQRRTKKQMEAARRGK